MIDSFTIRRDVQRVATRASSKYPFAKLAVGESFTIEDDGIVALRRVRNAASEHQRRHGGIYRVSQGEDGLWACWRLR